MERQLMRKQEGSKVKPWLLFLPSPEGFTNKINEVAYLHNGEYKQLYAAKAFVLSSGIHSPEILLRSGIGPKEELKAAGISPMIDLPVGKNLANHLILMLK